MIFHGLVGDDQREEKSPSYFNPEECSMVVQYVKDLLDESKGIARKVKAKEIGIISPYRYIFTVWKFHDFSIIQILREINF